MTCGRSERTREKQPSTPRGCWRQHMHHYTQCMNSCTQACWDWPMRRLRSGRRCSGRKREVAVRPEAAYWQAVGYQLARENRFAGKAKKEYLCKRFHGLATHHRHAASPRLRQWDGCRRALAHDLSRYKHQASNAHIHNRQWRWQDASPYSCWPASALSWPAHSGSAVNTPRSGSGICRKRPTG